MFAMTFRLRLVYDDVLGYIKNGNIHRSAYTGFHVFLSST